MRIALATEGSRGDLHPMFALAQGLQARGHEVVFCGPPDAQADAERFGVEFRSVGCSVREFLEQNAPAVRHGGLRLLRATMQYMGTSATRQFEELPVAVADADLVIGAGVQIAGRSAAELAGVPYRYVVYCPGFLPSRAHPPLTVRSAHWPRFANALLWRIGLFGISRLARRHVDPQRARLGLPPAGDFLQHLVGPAPVVASDPELASVEHDGPFAPIQVGYLHPRHDDEVPEKVLDFIATGARPVYVGFGSMTDPNPRATTELVAAAAERAQVRVLLSAGWAGLGEMALPSNLQVLGAVPHTKLFPRLAGAVHHGGAGTTATAARSGVPQLVVPHLLDQFYWGPRVHQRGLGPAPIARTKLTVEGLAQALRELANNEFLAERSSEVGDVLRRRDAAGAAIDALLA